ncbi:MAG: IPT/TIG domain-containing protein, partial [Pseudomonadota bacterium]
MSCCHLIAKVLVYSLLFQIIFVHAAPPPPVDPNTFLLSASSSHASAIKQKKHIVRSRETSDKRVLVFKENRSKAAIHRTMRTHSTARKTKTFRTHHTHHSHTFSNSRASHVTANHRHAPMAKQRKKQLVQSSRTIQANSRGKATKTLLAQNSRHGHPNSLRVKPPTHSFASVQPRSRSFPYVDALTPLLLWTQTGNLSNLSINSQPLGFSSSLNAGINLSDLTGVSFNPQYIFPMEAQLALGFFGDYGQYRAQTLAYDFSPISQANATEEQGEQLVHSQSSSLQSNSRSKASKPPVLVAQAGDEAKLDMDRIMGMNSKGKTKKTSKTSHRHRHVRGNPSALNSVTGENANPAVPLSSLPYVGPLAPLLNWAQTGTFSNIALTSQQLGFSGPLSGGVSYSNVTGIFFNAKYIFSWNDQLAFGLLGEYGPEQYRMNGTVGYGFSPLSQVKLSGERLGQRLPFQFDSGNIKQRVHQDAVGARFQQLFEQPFFQGVNIGGYYARAANQSLAPVIFESNGLNAINYRHIAGAKSGGIDAGTELLLTPSTLLSGNLYFDRVRYDTQLTRDTSKDGNGLGGSLNLKQLLGSRLKLWGEASIRKIYNTYQGGLSWLPISKSGLELTVLGEHVGFHNTMPNNSSVSLQVKWLPEGEQNYDKRFHWKNKHLPAIGQWVQTPAVYMQQVLAVAEQVTQLVGPGITSIVPNSGPPAGGNPVIITGSNFANGAMVFFGGQLATTVTWLSPTMLEVVVPGTTPLPVAQEVNVTVQNPDGQQATLENGYTYLVEPIINSINPASGPTAGNQIVTITGSDFTGATAVTFGGISAAITSVSDTQITVITPANMAGPVPVVVFTPAGDSRASAATYTYVGVPSITMINPTAGPTAGVQLVTITGTGFLGVTQVSFGSSPAVIIPPSSDTQIKVLSPPHVVGPVNVVVTAPGGVSLPSIYTYVDVPTISSITPASGLPTGGDAVIITGTGFTTVGTGTTVTFDASPPVPASSINPSGTSLTVVVPPGTSSPTAVPVVVTTPGGSSAPSPLYTYADVPAVTTITPAAGLPAGGNPVTITGSGFVAGSMVTFDSSAPVAASSVNPAGTSLTV